MTEVTQATTEQAVEQEQPLTTHPMIERDTPVQEPVIAPETMESHSEGSESPQQELEQEQPTEPQSFADMVGSDLMQDPASRIVVRSLEALVGDLDIERAFNRAIEEDDARFIDVAYLQEKLGDKAQDAIDAAKYLLEYADTVSQRYLDEVYSVVPGGEEALRVATQHFNATADAATKQVIANLLDSGDVTSMKFAAQQIMQSARGVVPKAGNSAPASSVGSTGAGVGISRAQFTEMYQKNPNMPDREYQKLREQLALGLQQGL